jgi:type II secretory pathway pseudopilin PulG
MITIPTFKKGFTLIETIVTISVFFLIFGLITTFIVSNYRTQGYAKEQAQAVDEARRGIEVMVRDIRGAKIGADGSYPIERADDKQFIFYNDIDGDGKVERVRYFLGTVSAGNSTKECSISSQGGTCSVSFSNFLTGELKSAQVRVTVDGDLDNSNEYIAIYSNGNNLGNICQTTGSDACGHCLNSWQKTTVYDITSQAGDNLLTFLADASNNVGYECPNSSHPTYAAKAKFELSWSEEVIGLGNELKKGVVKPVGNPATYPLDQEVVTTVTSYVRNDPPIFKYYDAAGNEITALPARLNDTKMVKVYLVINIDPNRPPKEFELESFVQLRNLKTE